MAQYGCDCSLCRGFMTPSAARRGSTAEIIRTVLKDNIRGNSWGKHTCRNCGRRYHEGSGRWSHSLTHQDLLRELRRHYVMIGEGAHIRVYHSSAVVYHAGSWTELGTAADVRKHLLDRRARLKSEYRHHRFCCMECCLTYCFQVQDVMSEQVCITCE